MRGVLSERTLRRLLCMFVALGLGVATSLPCAQPLLAAAAATGAPVAEQSPIEPSGLWCRGRPVNARLEPVCHCGCHDAAPQAGSVVAGAVPDVAVASAASPRPAYSRAAVVDFIGLWLSPPDPIPIG